MPQERNRAARVIVQEGDRLQVEHEGKRMTVPMRGFPAGFQLRPDRRVILFDEPSGPVARPLVRSIRSRQQRQVVANRGALEHEGRRLELQDGTIVDERQTGGTGQALEEYDMWVVEGPEGERTLEVIAARLRSPEHTS